MKISIMRCGLWTLLPCAACGVIDNPAIADGELSGSGTSEISSGPGTGSGPSTGPGDEATATDTQDSQTSAPSSSTGPMTTDESGDAGDCSTGAAGCPCLDAEDCDEGLDCEQGLCAEVFVCGDGIMEGDEACDDGDLQGGDGCEADCRLTKIVDVAAGGDHTCLLTEVGDVVCFGANGSGQLGYGHIQSIGDDELTLQFLRGPLMAKVLNHGPEHFPV